MNAEYYAAQIAFHEQVITNLEAQRDKLADFEAANQPFEIPEEPGEAPTTLNG